MKDLQSFVIFEEAYFRLRSAILAEIRSGSIELPEDLHVLNTDHVRPIFTRMEMASRMTA